MRGGSLIHRASFYARSTSPVSDEFGDPVDTLTLFASGVPCSLQPMQGREWHFAKQSQSENMVTMRMRYMSGIVRTMRVVIAGVSYEVQSVVDIFERHRELELRLSRDND